MAHALITLQELRITVTPHERHGVSNHWQPHSLFNRLLKGTSKKTLKSALLFLWQKSTAGFPSQKANKTEIYYIMTSS